MEFAIVLIPLLVLLFGIVQYGTIFLIQNQLTEAASDAARVAVPYTSLTDAEDAAQDRLDSLDLFSSSCDSGGAVTCSVAPSDSGATCVSPPSGYECLTVTITYDYASDPVLGLPWVPAPAHISGSSTVLIGNGDLTS